MMLETTNHTLSGQSWLSVEWILFTLACFIYAAALGFRVADFPIYFFCDEAFHSAVGQEVIKNGFRDSAGTLLPIYFNADSGRWTPAFSVYPQAIAAELFGRSVFTTRLTTVFISLFGVAGFSIFLRNSLKLGIWWLFPLLLAGCPAWFLHARTGFESPMMVSFLAGGLGFYSLYLTRGSGWGLLGAAISWGAAFYTYSNGQLVVPLFVSMLLLSDVSVHRRNIWTVAKCFAVALVLAAPLVMFLYTEGFKQSEHLATIGSPLISDQPLRDTISKIGREYLEAFNPQYWLSKDHGRDIARHYVGNLSHQVVWLGWAACVGAIFLLFRLKQSGARAVLALLLAAPAAGALAQVGITRVLGMVFPMVALAMLPADFIERRLKPLWLRLSFDIVLFLGALAGVGFVVRYALVVAPTQVEDYGLYGHQWGAQQIFGELIPELLHEHPEDKISVYSNWANAPERFIEFFLDEEAKKRVSFKQLDVKIYYPIDPSEIFVVPEADYVNLVKSGKVKPPEILRTLPYPNGEPGFRVVRLSYVDNVIKLYEEERRILVQRVPATVELRLPGAAERVTTTIRHSPIDLGEPQNLFDDNTETLIRGARANPFFLSIDMGAKEGRRVTSVALNVGVNAPILTLSCIRTRKAKSRGERDMVVTEKFEQSHNKRVTLLFPKIAGDCARIELAIADSDLQDFANVHVREVEVL
jgi:hypothetical protein